MFDVLKSFHEQGFIHRDIKESNLMIDENGMLFVIDFGLVQQRVKDGVPLEEQRNQPVKGSLYYASL